MFHQENTLSKALDMNTLKTKDEDFDSKFDPENMRCLALIAHGNMKPALKDFVLRNKNVLKKFRLTGTESTMAMIEEIYKEEQDIQYGPTCKAGPLGGNAELCALLCLEEIGGIILLQDPMDSHVYQPDIDSLNRQALIHNIMLATNCASACAMIESFRFALKSGKKELISSFFETNYSPSVEEYKRRQNELMMNDSMHIDTRSERSLDQNALRTRDQNFTSVYDGDDMRCLALVAHNHMLPAMYDFINENKNTLKKFRLIGTNETIEMMHEIFGDDETVKYGPTFPERALGGEAKLCAFMCLEQVGGIICLQDPIDTHPHQFDTNALNRQANMDDIYIANTLSAAKAMMFVLRTSIENGRNEKIMSFFQTNVSPSITAYKLRKQSAN